MEAAKWSAFIENGFYPERPLFLPDELYSLLDPNSQTLCLRQWSVRRVELLARDGMDDQLLLITKDHLNEIVACIMQTDAASASDITGQLGRAITAKLVGAGASAGLLGLAAAVGTASTGTAIGTLSGAALVSSQLAWIGSFAGGGMLAGSIMTGGVGILVGIVALVLMGRYRTKPRQYKDLPVAERQLVDKCAWMVQAIDEEMKRDSIRSWALQEKVFREHIVSLHEALIENEEPIAANLSSKYRLRFSRRVIPDFGAKVVDVYKAHFERVNLPHLLYRERAAMVIVTTVLWKLWRQEFTFDTVEEQLVIEALRRSKAELSDASLADLGSYVSSFDSAELKGLANNVKGIYHELRFVQQFNNENPLFIAELHPATNHPGSDVVIRHFDSGEVAQEAQLKATESNTYILEHFEKYRDVPVIATVEVAEEMEGVESSGMSDLSLETDVRDGFSQLEDFGPFSEAVDAAAVGGLLGLILYGAGSDKGRRKASQGGRRALEGAGIAAGTTAVISYLFG